MCLSMNYFIFNMTLAYGFFFYVMSQSRQQNTYFKKRESQLDNFGA